MTSTVAVAPEAPRVDLIEFVLAVVGFIALILLLPFVLILSGPFAGWFLGAVLFSLSWAGQRFVTRMSERMDPTHAVGVTGISSIGRAMLVVAILFVIALKVDETVGLVAGGVFAAAFTLDLIGRTVLFSILEKKRRIAGENPTT